MADLSKVKKGDFVAVVHSGGFTNATTATKAVVVKKNPASVVISHQGKEHKVNLQGHGLVSSFDWVEPWDDAKEEKRAHDAKIFTAREALKKTQGPMTLPFNTLTPEDVLREPEKFAEIQRLQAEFLARTKELAQAIVATRA